MSPPPKIRFHPKDWVPFQSLYGFVRLVLCVCWDPIGVFGHRQTLDEYDSYVGPICQLLRKGASAEQLKAHLTNVEQVSIGVNRGPCAQLDLTVQQLLRVRAEWLEEIELATDQTGD